MQLKVRSGGCRKELEELTDGMEQTDSGLYYKINREGSGDYPSKVRTFRFIMRGMLLDGTVFDSSYQRNEPIVFPLGMGQVIKGWDEGIALLKRGSSAKLVFQVNWLMARKGLGV